MPRHVSSIKDAQPCFCLYFTEPANSPDGSVIVGNNDRLSPDSQTSGINRTSMRQFGVLQCRTIANPHPEYALSQPVVLHIIVGASVVFCYFRAPWFPQVVLSLHVCPVFQRIVNHISAIR